MAASVSDAETNWSGAEAVSYTHLDVYKRQDKPCVIGEWHIGGGDGGLLSCGLLASATQEERGRACEYYMQQAMSARNCVGLHYFEMNDQPLLGRLSLIHIYT